MSVACTTSRVYVGTAPGASGRATLRSMSLSESDERIEAQSVGAVRSVSIGSGLGSPDEAWVAYGGDVRGAPDPI